MKKILFVSLFLLTACPYFGDKITYVGNLKNTYDDSVFLVKLKNGKTYYTLHLEKDEIFSDIYEPRYSLEEKCKKVYFIYKDKDKKELITSFSSLDFIRIGSKLGFSENGIFKLDD